MLNLTPTLKGLVGAMALTVAFSGTAQAGDFVGLDSSTGAFYSIDSGAGTATNLGPLAGAPPFGFGLMDRALGGNLYATSPGLISGYSIYQIDPSTLTATLLHSITSSSTGGVGIAVHPSGTRVWVAGFVGLSLNIVLEEIDLSTGAILTTHNTLSGNMWGLAFDSSGNLVSTVQGPSAPQLTRIDTNTGVSYVLFSEMTGVDQSLGIDLSSDAGSGSLHLISRATDNLYSVSSFGKATLVSNLVGGGALFTIAEHPVFCTLVNQYGAGCAGSGGFVPVLDMTGCPSKGAQVSVELSNGIGGNLAMLLFGLGQGSVPAGSGCDLLLSNLTPLVIVLPMGGFGIGNGQLSLSSVIPSNSPSVSFTMQALCADPQLGTGFTMTNGLKITIP